MSLPRSPRLRDYTNVPFEIFIAVLTILPFFLLAYFYSTLSDRIPLFLNFKGEVVEWAEKSVLSVFRVPLLALIIQVVCLLMKYGTIQATLDEQALHLNARLWDWLRWSSAVKMIAESVDTIFLSLDLRSLSRSTFIITAIAALVGVAGALVYGYRLLVSMRAMKQKSSDRRVHEPVDARHVYGGILYFNPSDSAFFSRRYIFNFGNKWAWIFIACIIAYPLLVFWAR